MKIKSIWISNVLSFKYFTQINDAQELKLNDGVNILIGQNGAGKSTMLEVINFICKRVLFRSVPVNENYYSNWATLEVYHKRQVITMPNHNNAGQLRLDPNWDTEGEMQTIKVAIQLDDVDRVNLSLLHQHKSKMFVMADAYTENSNFLSDINFEVYAEEIVLEIQMRNQGVPDHSKTFTVQTLQVNDTGYLYLMQYNFFKELINLYNREHPEEIIPSLTDSFTFISGYRNYSAFNPHVSLRDQDAVEQIQMVRSMEYSKSLNTIENTEPGIFSLVRLLIAKTHFEVFGNGVTPEEAENLANNQSFMIKINQKLNMVDLKVKISLLDKRNWSYTFTFIDTKRDKALTDINSLSAGQKAIVHLVFEAYGRGTLEGGVVIIDEPEIHLHYQFQDEYLRIIEELNREQRSQYILVTHSDSLINSGTISQVKRFFLDSDNHTRMVSPVLTENQRTLIKILDNTRSTYAFFGKKVILVEGDTDRYFFRALMLMLYPELAQEITILDIGGKGNYSHWKSFFEVFELQVFFIGDFDNVFTVPVNGNTIISKEEKNRIEAILRQAKLNALTVEQQSELALKYSALITDENFLIRPQRLLWKPLVDQFIKLVSVSNQELVNEIKATYTDIDTSIEQLYENQVYILKRGSLEAYLNTRHSDLGGVINFCESQLGSWLLTSDSAEIKQIIRHIVLT